MVYVSKIMKLFMATPEDGAKTSVYVATSDEIEGGTGEYFEKYTIKDISKKCKDAEFQKKFRQLSEGLTGLAS